MRLTWERIIHECSKLPSPSRDDGEIRRCKEHLRAAETPTKIPSDCETEVRALSIAQQNECTSMPHLIGFKQLVQGPDGPLPGGYVTITIMTKVPGRSLHAEWDCLDERAREKLRDSLILAIKYAYHRLTRGRC